MGTGGALRPPHNCVGWGRRGKGGVQDRTIYEDSVFARMLHDAKLMDDRDYDTYYGHRTRSARPMCTRCELVARQLDVLTLSAHASGFGGDLVCSLTTDIVHPPLGTCVLSGTCRCSRT